MDYNFLNNNPMLKNMSPEKLQFLMNFAGSQKPTDIKDMMPFLLGTMNSAKEKNIQFTAPETELLVQILKQNMSEEEAAKADKILKLMAKQTAPIMVPSVFSYQMEATFTSSTLSIGADVFPMPSVPSKYFSLADSNKT